MHDQQKSPVVSWFKRVLRRGSVDREEDINGHSYNTNDEPAPQSAPSLRLDAHEVSEEHDTAKVLSSPTSPSIASGTTPHHGHRERHGDSASVMTIASSSKHWRRSLDTNVSTRAVLAESVYSADGESSRSTREDSDATKQG